MKTRSVVSLIGILAIAALLVFSVTASASDQARAATSESKAVTAQATTAVSAKPAKVKRARVSVNKRNKVSYTDQLKMPGRPSGYICETNNNFTSCECKGANDCYALITSGKCDGKTWWEDGDDPSIGGCDGND